MTNPCSRAAVQLVLISCLALPAGILWAQNENDTVGFQTNHIFESGQFGENIDILNGGVNLSIPIGPKYQVSRFLAYQLQLAYGSKIWDHTPYPSYVDGLFRRSTLGLGFSMHFGRIYKDVERVNPDKASCVWYYVSPDGNEHALPPGETQDGCDSLPANGFTVDRSYYRVEGLSAWDGTTGPAPILLMYT